MPQRFPSIVLRLRMLHRHRGLWEGDRFSPLEGRGGSKAAARWLTPAVWRFAGDWSGQLSKASCHVLDLTCVCLHQGPRQSKRTENYPAQTRKTKRPFAESIVRPCCTDEPAAISTHSPVHDSSPPRYHRKWPLVTRSNTSSFFLTLTHPSGAEAVEKAQDSKQPARPTQHEPSKKQPVCRFYNTKKGRSIACFIYLLTVHHITQVHPLFPSTLTKISFCTGCRAGQSCRFQHPPPEELAGAAATQPELSTPAVPEHSHQAPSENPNMPSPSAKVVAWPTPKALMDDPRAFQINQIQRRFKPTVSELGDVTTLTFEMRPSDPDFPYEIEALECRLTVPKSYPASGKPSLAVTNKDIPRGFQLNIERGFDKISAASPSAYLLGLMNRLDQQLESILSGQKAETITLVSNRAPPPKPVPSEASQTTAPAPQKPVAAKVEPSPQELDDARKKRQADVRQLEARFGRLPHYAKSADGLTYTLPLDSPKRSTWPPNLQPLRSFQLKVPGRYPLEALEARLFNDSPEAKAIETAFKERSAQDQKATITQQVNYLSSHIREMAVPSAPVKDDAKPPQKAQSGPQPASNEAASKPSVASASQEYDDSHIQHIPRPPEWDAHRGSGEDSSSDSYESDLDSEGEDEENTKEAQDSRPSESTAPAERGILLSFPRLELHGIELLELTSLNLTVKCERCKETTDIEKLRSSAENSKMREVSCKKCATTLAVRFRADLIHANSVRAGYLDLDACTVVDMLPSNFLPTCSQCSTQYPAPGIMAVRGDNSIAICRECHTKMSVKILEVKFLLVSASARESLPCSDMFNR